MSGAATTPLRKRFIRVAGRLVHYRVAGQGPAVVMLHDSPRSSRLHVQTMRHLAKRFQVFALDTPGYGNSEPLEGARLEIADFAQALGDALAALGLRGAPLYATHTSAKIALHYAAATAAPPLVLLDGLSIPQGATDEDFISRYMRDFTVDADGAYLATEWTRLRDMLRWFPWFDARTETRMPITTPDDAWIEAYALDVFSAGPHYADAYAAAMRYDPLPALRRVIVPTVVAARADDVLIASLDRVPHDLDAVTVERLAGDAGEWLAWLEAKFALSAKLPAPAVAAVPQREGPHYVDLASGQMFVCSLGPARGRPLLVLEAPTTLHARLWQLALAGQCRTIVPDLAGYGESDPLRDASLSDHADSLAAVLADFGETEVDVLALGFASPLAVELALRHPGRVARLVLDGATRGPDAQATRLCPAFAMRLSGGHLHDIWHMLRDSEAHWPWYDGSRAAQRCVVPVLDAGPLHRALLDVLKQPVTYGDAAIAGLHAAIPYGRLSLPVLLLRVDGDPAYRDTAAVAAMIPEGRVLERPTDIAGTASLLSALLGTAAQNLTFGQAAIPFEKAMPACL